MHSHRFAAANTAVAYVNNDAVQLKANEDFLQSGFITVDLFAAPRKSLLHQEKVANAAARSRTLRKLASTFAVGEEAEQTAPAVIREVGKVAAPLDAAWREFSSPAPPYAWMPWCAPARSAISFRAEPWMRSMSGWNSRPRRAMDACSRGAGASKTTAAGRSIKARTSTESYQLDAEGNQINKRNAWQARSVLYVRLIPPGAADTVHYRLHDPQRRRRAHHT